MSKQSKFLKFAVLNALLLGVGSLVSQLIAYGYPPSFQAVYSSALLGIGVFIATLYQDIKKVYNKLKKSLEEQPEAKTKAKMDTPDDPPKNEEKDGEERIYLMVI